MKKKISFIFGTRPEAIKLCPLVLTMQGHSELQPHICVTSQHREMLDQVLEAFDIRPDVDLALMNPNQTLGGFASLAIAAIDVYLREHKPDMVIVQGDTTTVFCAALCAFYQQIPVGHVEAGLRTWNKFSPFPEEINRVLTTRLSDQHYAPTLASQENLIREGVPTERIFITGNTVIDALYMAVEKIKEKSIVIPGLPSEIMSDGKPLVLITGHRRENFGDGFENMCHAIAELARRFPKIHFVYPVHLNPNVQEPVNRILGQQEIQNIDLIKPLGYLPFISLMNRAKIILTDSGGVQEEAPSLGKPVLVMRDTTERPEAVDAGVVKLVGTDSKAIIDNATALLTDAKTFNAMSNASNPYGDGKACGRILAACSQFLHNNKPS